MATVLDAGLAGHFSIIFSVILVLVLVFAILKWTKALGDNTAVQAIIAVCVAVLMLIFPFGLALVEIMAQWFSIILIFAIFVLLFYRLFGASDDDFSNVLKNYTPLKWLIFAVVILVFALGALKVRSDMYGSNNPFYGNESVYLDEHEGEVSGWAVEHDGHYINVLLHPNVMGIGVILLIVVFTIALIAGRPNKPWP